MKKNQSNGVMGNFLREVLEDKDRLLVLVLLLLGVLFVTVFFGKKGKSIESAPNTEEVNQAFPELDTEGEKRTTSKVDAYKREREETVRKKRELERSQVKGSDFYFEIQTSEDGYNEEMKIHIEKVEKGPLDEVTSEYRGRGKRSSSALSDKTHQQLNDIEGQETFNQIVKEAKREERIHRELEENARFRDEMRKKYQDQASGKSTEKPRENILPKVNDSAPGVERASEPTFIVGNGKRRRRSQSTIDQEVNLIKAAIYGDQTAVNGSTARMRLLEPLWVGDIKIPANTILHGDASVDSTRLKITVENTRYGKYISPTAFTIYDSDVIEGLNLPNSMKAEAARKVEQGLPQGVQFPIFSIGTVTSEVISAIIAATQVTRQILDQSFSQVEVHLKANYSMYIKEKIDEDRKKREEEKAEIERLYREIQMQQNEPKKKNPLTQLIEAL